MQVKYANISAIVRMFTPGVFQWRTLGLQSRKGIRPCKSRYRRLLVDAKAGRIILVNRVPHRPADRAIAGLPYRNRAQWRADMALQRAETARRREEEKVKA